MKKIYLYIIVTFIVINLKGQILNLPYLGASECGNWCWVNSCRHIISYYGYDDITACELAEYSRSLHPSSLGTTNCCQDVNQGCCIGGYLDWMVEIFNHWGLNANYTYTPLTINEITTELASNRPFVIRYPGHVNIGYGISGDNIYIRDPGWGWDIRTYNLLISDTTNNNHYRWTETIRITNSPTSCDLNRLLTGTVSNSGLYKASGKYDVSCVINNSANVTIKAPISITLNSNFSMELGSTLELITGSNVNTNCP